MKKAIEDFVDWEWWALCLDLMIMIRQEEEGRGEKSVDFFGNNLEQKRLPTQKTRKIFRIEKMSLIGINSYKKKKKNQIYMIIWWSWNAKMSFLRYFLLLSFYCIKFLLDLASLIFLLILLSIHEIAMKKKKKKIEFWMKKKNKRI